MFEWFLAVYFRINNNNKNLRTFFLALLLGLQNKTKNWGAFALLGVAGPGQREESFTSQTFPEKPSLWVGSLFFIKNLVLETMIKMQ